MPDNSTTGTAVRYAGRSSSLTADTVLYTLDAASYRHVLQDVIACKTDLLRMKRLLQQVESLLLYMHVYCSEYLNEPVFEHV